MTKTFPKWPRTYHHVTSGALQNDDRMLPSTAAFYDANGQPRRTIFSRKMDGENTTMTRELTYPRSPDGRYHPSRDQMKAYHATKAPMIPEDWRICGESMTARHSVEYSAANGNALGANDIFLGFGVWDANNTLLSWDDTLEVFEMLDIAPVEVLHDGPYDEAVVARLAAANDPQRSEGFVARVADAMPYPSGEGDAGRFFMSAFKWVRKNHVLPSDEHWASGQWEPNEFAGD